MTPQQLERANQLSEQIDDLKEKIRKIKDANVLRVARQEEEMNVFSPPYDTDVFEYIPEIANALSEKDALFLSFKNAWISLLTDELFYLEKAFSEL